MELTDRDLSRQRIEAHEKDIHAIITRDFSASRMNATKWREVIKAIGEDHSRYRFRWVHVSEVSAWMCAWIPHPNSTYFDTASAGPFRTFVIEWMEIDPINRAEETERQLQAINVPYEWVDGYIRIVGYVRNTRDATE